MRLLPNVIETKRTVLRMWTATDIEVMAALVAANVEHLRPWMPWVGFEPLTTAARRELIAGWHSDWEAGGGLVVGVFLDGLPIGGSGYHVNRGPNTLEIGYWIAASHSRRGLATEVSAALTTTAFTVAGIDRVEIHHDKANVASEGVPRRLGYVIESETAGEITSPGEVGIDCCWAMTPDRWSQRRVGGLSGGLAGNGTGRGPRRLDRR
jgi:ribosomal-protein-serine acetyltransferase